MMTRKSFVTVLLLLAATTTRAEIRRAEIKVFGMD
jgi:hypothetical protein